MYFAKLLFLRSENNLLVQTRLVQTRFALRHVSLPSRLDEQDILWALFIFSGCPGKSHIDISFSLYLFLLLFLAANTNTWRLDRLEADGETETLFSDAAHSFSLYISTVLLCPSHSSPSVCLTHSNERDTQTQRPVRGDCPFVLGRNKGAIALT